MQFNNEYALTKFIFFIGVYNIIIKYDKLYHTYIKFVKREREKEESLIIVIDVKNTHWT